MGLFRKGKICIIATFIALIKFFVVILEKGRRSLTVFCFDCDGQKHDTCITFLVLSSSPVKFYGLTLFYADRLEPHSTKFLLPVKNAL